MIDREQALDSMPATASSASRRSRNAVQASYVAQPRDVVQGAYDRLRSDPTFHGRTRLINIEKHGDCLVLTGRLPSFYLKQLLQSRLRDVEGISQIENRVEVFWPHETT